MPGTTTTTPPAPTTMIFVHGAWHHASCFDPLINSLRSNNTGIDFESIYSVVKVSLPSTSCPTDSLSMVSWQPDVDAVLQTLDSQISRPVDGHKREVDNKNILVTSHSYGSLVANEAIWSLLSSEPEVTTRMNLKHLILCDFNFEAGEAIRNPATTDPYPGLWDVKGNIVYTSADAADWFYHDLTEEEKQKYAKELGHIPLKSFTSLTKYAAWKDIATTYLHCEKDRAIPIAKQESMVSRVIQAGGLIQTARVVSGHSPFLVVPEQVVEVIRQLMS